ncbi:MAG TPA: SsrA-binding protein SmpB [Bdellovibrionota bacterium]|jgi:SsrA-binding protein|nr:SsrA-binding protein SmpB [Bdellovibrionota bacterium]
MSEGEKLISANKKARHDFHIVKTFEAGMVLKGSEVKSCRDGRVQLLDSYASFEKGELYLHKVNIAEFKQSGPFFNHEPARKRKLLMHRREMENLKAEMEQSGSTLVPLRMYFKKGKAKVELGLAKGKNKGDKRQALKAKDEERSIRQAKKRG